MISVLENGEMAVTSSKESNNKLLRNAYQICFSNQENIRKDIIQDFCFQQKRKGKRNIETVNRFKLFSGIFHTKILHF